MVQPTAKAWEALGKQKLEGTRCNFCVFACLYKPTDLRHPNGNFPTTNRHCRQVKTIAKTYR